MEMSWVCLYFIYMIWIGAGAGWTKSILNNKIARNEFENFFQRRDTFTFGVCNGCQMLSALKELIPGSNTWPRFVQNKNEQFEARICMVEVLETNSIFLNGMAGSIIPVAIAHGEGNIDARLVSDVYEKNACLRFVDMHEKVANVDRYPYNPNGSIGGLTGFSSTDGRVLIMMPHPERMTRRVANTWMHSSYQMSTTEEEGPWTRLFHNARRWVEKKL